MFTCWEIMRDAIINMTDSDYLVAGFVVAGRVDRGLGRSHQWSQSFPQ